MTPTLSIVIPTFNRAALVVRAVEHVLADVGDRPDVEVVVVADGCTDDTEARMRTITEVDPRVHLVTQPNGGAAAARNAGARAARGDVLVFLDDDMAVRAGSVRAHEQALEDPETVVSFGRITTDDDSPDNLVTAGIRTWSQERTRRLDSGEPIEVRDLISGHFALRARTFHAVGGFAETFTAGGHYGGEDTEFFGRLILAGQGVGYTSGATSSQFCEVSAPAIVKRSRDAGQSDAVLTHRLPELGRAALLHHTRPTLAGRLAVRAVVALPARPWSRLEQGAVRAAHGARPRSVVHHLLLVARERAYWNGVRAGGGIALAPAPTALAYHDVPDGPATGDEVALDCLVDQVTALRERGWHFVRSSELARHQRSGWPLPQRSVALTFDDGYASICERVAPALAEMGIPATVFVVTDRVGGNRTWDGCSSQLLSGDAIRTIATQGWEVGAHSRTHQHLGGLGRDSLGEEVAGSVADVRTLLERPVADIPFAYPYGEHNATVRRALAASGASVGFALGQHHGPWALPRIEVTSRDTATSLAADLETRTVGTTVTRPPLAVDASALRGRPIHLLRDTLPLSVRRLLRGDRS